MAVDLYSGCPGSGKSLLATYQIIDYLLAKKNVIANFPIDLKYFKKRKIGKFLYVPTSKMSVLLFLQFAREYHKHPERKKSETLIVIDEASIIFNPRNWDRKDRSDWIFFLANHRHLQFDVIVIAQTDRMLDRQIRGIIETDFRCRSMRQFGIAGKILNLLFGGIFVAVPYNNATKTKSFIGHYFRLHRRKAKVYDTMQLFENMQDFQGGVKNVQGYSPATVQSFIQNTEKIS